MKKVKTYPQNQNSRRSTYACTDQREGLMKTKNVYKECLNILNKLSSCDQKSIGPTIERMRKKYQKLHDNSYQDIFSSVLDSHKAMCKIKNMGKMEAFGHNPSIFYGLALSGECGELANKLVKVIRVNGTREQEREAIGSELQDVAFYMVLLAYTMEINIVKLVNEKAKIVIERAKSGYYGGALK